VARRERLQAADEPLLLADVLAGRPVVSVAWGGWRVIRLVGVCGGGPCSVGVGGGLGSLGRGGGLGCGGGVIRLVRV